jgi:hypothetical protein
VLLFWSVPCTCWPFVVQERWFGHLNQLGNSLRLCVCGNGLTQLPNAPAAASVLLCMLAPSLSRRCRF